MSGPRPFLDYLREHRSGASHDMATEQFQALVGAVAAEGKAGTLTITVSVRPSDVGRNAVMVDMKVAAKPPKAKDPASIWFVTPEGNLEREDPAQQRLALRGLDAAEPPRALPASVARALA